MSHGKIREDKTCLNCGHTVEEIFCPHCGQENTETRQPFYFLFTHFIEDFTHYDGQFWKTIKYLLVRPGKLTKEYILGKRQIYVAPVKLYIFISFITFLLPGIIPQTTQAEAGENTSQAEQREATKKVLDELQEERIITDETHKNAKSITDSLQIKDSLNQETILRNGDIFDPDTAFGNAHTLKEYDSIYAKKGGLAFMISRPCVKKIFELKESGLTRDQIINKYKETLISTIPKALFIYLPVFAFFLWLFHDKKRWWYFDHGVFTLHYFSFLLLATLIFIMINRLGDWLPDNTLFTLIFSIIKITLFVYTCIYFFIAHHRTYESKKRTSIIKGIILFLINLIGLLIMLCILIYVSLIMLH